MLPKLTCSGHKLRRQMASHRYSPDGEPNPVAYSLHLRLKSSEPSILLCTRAQPPGNVSWSHDMRSGDPRLPGEMRYRPLGPRIAPQSANRPFNDPRVLNRIFVPIRGSCRQLYTQGVSRSSEMHWRDEDSERTFSCKRQRKILF
jgi:hypothetical protein